MKFSEYPGVHLIIASVVIFSIIRVDASSASGIERWAEYGDVRMISQIAFGTVTASVVLLVLMFFFSMTLEGTLIGWDAYLQPKWQQLLNVQVKRIAITRKYV